MISADDFNSDVPIEQVEDTTEVNEVTETNEVTDFEVVTNTNEAQPTFNEEMVVENTNVSEDIPTEDVKRVTRTGSETEVREVDPTKNAKLQKRMKQAKTTVAVGKFKIPKKLLYVAIPVGIIALMLIVKGISGLIGGKSDDGNYFTILDNIVQSEKGHFVYSIDVRTSEIPKAEPSTESASTEGSTEVVEIAEETESEPVYVPKNKFNDSWGTADDVKTFSWQYPKYNIIIEGDCVDNNPDTYTADIKISLKTEGHNDVLTEIIAKEGYYYIDFNSLGVWLRNSRDAYLMSLGADIPEGAKYVKIKAEDLAIPSRYAEQGTEKDNSAIIGYQNNAKILRLLIQYLEKNLQTVIGDECYKVSTAEGVSTHQLNIGPTTGTKIANQYKNLILNSSATYDGFTEALKNNNLINDKQIAQRANEKDNFLYAINPLQVYFNTNSLDLTNLQAKGSARQYNNYSGHTVAEADLAVQFQSDSKFYTIQLDLTRELGTDATVEVDAGNVIDINSLLSESVETDGLTYLLGKFNSVADYLNPTCIQLGKQLEMSPDRLEENIKQSLVDIVNSVPQAGVYLTTLTVDKYIEIYKELIDKKDTLPQDSQDLYNTLLVEDFLNTVNGVTGGVIVEVPVEAEQELIKYPELVYEDSDMKIIANYNQELSNKDVIVVSATIMNKTDNTINLNLTNFSLRTLLESVYSSNNLTTLRDNDNTWDESLTPQSIELGASSYAEVDLYFVVSGDSGYMDMWYQPIDKDVIKLGVIVQE